MESQQAGTQAEQALPVGRRSARHGRGRRRSRGRDRPGSATIWTRLVAALSTTMFVSSRSVPAAIRKVPPPSPRWRSTLSNCSALRMTSSSRIGAVARVAGDAGAAGVLAASARAGSGTGAGRSTGSSFESPSAWVAPAVVIGGIEGRFIGSIGGVVPPSSPVVVVSAPAFDGSVEARAAPGAFARFATFSSLPTTTSTRGGAIGAGRGPAPRCASRTFLSDDPNGPWRAPASDAAATPGPSRNTRVGLSRSWRSARAGRRPARPASRRRPIPARAALSDPAPRPRNRRSWSAAVNAPASSKRGRSSRKGWNGRASSGSSGPPSRRGPRTPGRPGR